MCCLICALVLNTGNFLAANEANADRYRQIAVIGDTQLQQSGLTDLISIELQNAGMELVGRERLDRVTWEQSFSAALGPDATKTRIRIGSLAGAAALVLVHVEETEKTRNIRVIVAECGQGARLSSDLFSLDPPITEVVRRIAVSVVRTRQRFAGGVKAMVAIPPFLARNFSYEYHPLQSGYAALLAESLAEAPGLAVVDVEEAQAIRTELDLSTAPQAAGVVPIFVQGEYEVIADANKVPRVQFTVALNTPRTSRSIVRHGLTLGEASKFISRDLPAEVVPDYQAGLAQPFTTEAEFARLTARADEFAALGEWQHAVSLRQAALVIDPDSSAQRARVADESLLLIIATNHLPGPRPSPLVARLMQVWQGALVSLEWEIHRHGDTVPASQISRTLHEGLIVARGSAWAGDAQRLKRDFILRVFPMAGNPQGEDPQFPPPVQPAWAWVEKLMYVAVYSDGQPLTGEDYSVLLSILNGVVPENLEPSTWLTDLLWGQNDHYKAQRGSSDFVLFLHQLEGSNRPVNQIVAKVSRLSARVEHGERVDAAMRQEIEKLRGAYLDLHLEPIPVAHAGVLRQLDHLRDGPASPAPPQPPADLGASTQPAGAPPAKNLAPGDIEAGALRFVMLHVRQRRPDGAVVGAQDGRLGLIHGLGQLVRCGSTLAVAWDGQCVNFMRQAGLLETVWDTGDVRTFADVQWDGSHIWIATFNDGLWVVDTSGQPITKIGPAQGLPACDREIRLSVLGRDRVIFAGSFGPVNRSLLALVDKPGEAYRVKVFHTATQVLEPGVRVSTQNAMDKGLAFSPEQIGVCHCRDKEHEFVVVRRSGAAVGHALVIDAKTLQAAAPQSVLQSANFTLSGGWILQPVKRGSFALWQLAPNGDFVLESTVQLPCTRAEMWRIATPAAGANDPIYVIGSGWYRVDPLARTARRLTPDGAMGSFSVRGVSFSHLGLLVWGASDRNQTCMYQVMVDEEKLKSTPATQPQAAR